MQVAYFRPDIGEEDLGAVASVLRSGWLTTGPVARDFEHEFCRVTGAAHAVAVSSCTNGLHAALVAHGVGSGDEVITTPLTFCGTIRAIEESGAVPAFVDIGSDLNLDTRQLERAITPRTKAIVPVHIAGQPCDLLAIRQFASKYDLTVVEDAAHAFGAAWRGDPIGSSDFSSAVFSFYANKNLTSGEGGMITTSSAAIAARLRRVIAFGLQRSSEEAENRWQYEVVERGFKYNMSDVLAALGLSQLKKSAKAALLRRNIADRYSRELADLHEIELPQVNAGSRHAWHLYMVRLHLDQLEISRDEFVAELAARGVQCSVHFRPIPMHRWFAHYGAMENWPRTAREFPRLISLPIYPTLTTSEQEYVIEQIRAVVSGARKAQFTLVAGVSA